MAHLQSALGVVALLAFAWAISENRRAVDWKSAGVALMVTLATAVLPLKVPGIKTAFAGVNHAVDAVSAASLAAPPLCSAISAARLCLSNSKSPSPNSRWPSRRCRSCL